MPAPSWLFCAGHDFLSDGRLFVAGGHISDLHGLPDANDNCPATPNADQRDDDANGIGDACQGCAVRLPVAGLLVTKEPGERVRMSWIMNSDPCRARDRVFALLDPGTSPSTAFAL